MKTLRQRKPFLKYISTLLPAGSICAEIGVDQGRHARDMYDILRPDKFFLIDPWEIGADKNGETNRYNPSRHYPEGLRTAYSDDSDFEEVKKRFNKEIEQEKVIIKKGFSYDVVGLFSNDFFDLIYIDSCHLYGCVRADIENFLPKMKKNGLICGHDYRDKNFLGVERAVDEAVEHYGLEWAARSWPRGKDWAVRRKRF